MLDGDIEDIVDTWNRKSTRIGSCLGQNLYILLVFSQRIPPFLDLPKQCPELPRADYQGEAPDVKEQLALFS